MIAVKKLLIVGVLASALSACVNPNLAAPETQLEHTLSPSAAQLQASGESLKVILPVDTTFQGKTSRVTPKAMQALIQVNRTLHQYPDLRIKVVAYTDNRGDEKRSRLVSLRRAMVIADYFRNHGVSSARISTAGLGQADPIADNSTSQGRTQNRRVELQLS